MGFRGAAALIAVAIPAIFGVSVATAAQPTRDIIQVPSTGGVTPRVIGGHNASPTRWPYLTTVLNPEGLCSGELIGARWVLTARHCVTTQETGAVFAAGAMRVAVGVGNLSSRGDWLTPVRIVSFPGYHPSSSIGDLALIELRAPNTHQTAELATGPPDPTLTVAARIAGWGLTSDNAENPPNLPQEADTVIWPQSYCQSVYPPLPAPGFYDAGTELCAGGPDAGHDEIYPSICDGDSGGPLTLPGTGDAWTDRLVGITDYGLTAGCDVAPNAFQSVPAHLDWILRTTGLGAVGVVLRTTPVACVLRANAACPSHNLSGRNLAHRNLSRIDLRNSDLSGASLVGTLLIGARLGGANLTGANLSGADLTGADLTGVTWSQTTCPDGSNSSSNGTTPPTCLGH